MEPSRLFAVPDEPLSGPSLGSSAAGAAAEHLVIARLLSLGHRVAVPVVDDDGVDLVADYRTTVQVKSTGGLRGDRWVFELRAANKDGRAGSNEARAARSLADVFVLCVRDADLWWVIPRSALGSDRRITVAPGGRIDRQWRNAWHVFGEQ